MSIVHRFHFPAGIQKSPIEIKDATTFDLVVNRGDNIEFEALPGQRYRVEEKTFLLNFDESIERVDYVTSEVKP
ncbi:hypothetical protein [Pseudomonas sp. 3-2]|uniref:hypothetical protein n=1 Tax=Pseudomonas sp. 3-2 TaxID=2867408 RepID=UPI001C888A22|nr:hypothetical protein [Pseudomonas sp. 3-2]QZD72070.1 hypothetical protein K3819_04220 [Pseudomonas sp. 3-2]